MADTRRNGLQIVSDIHLEFRGGRYDIEPVGRYLCLLGDTGLLTQSAFGSYIDLVSRASSKFERVFLLYGNHEFYGSIVSEGMARLGAFLPRNVTILENGRFDVPDTNYRILGCALWSYVAPHQEAAVKGGLNDYSQIRVADPVKGCRMLQIADTNEWHRQSREWLTQQIEMAKSESKQVVVLTHHAPIPDANPMFPGSPLNPAFETDLRSMFAPPVVAWFYGHTHYSRTDNVNGILCMSNQVGYPHEGGKFNKDYVFNF
ncbi:ser/Thr protein phosphatase [Pelomyxa schiedti]|nr:ser/Thr protein phosphatase [Pelomyxa schiedti]